MTARASVAAVSGASNCIRMLEASPVAEAFTDEALALSFTEPRGLAVFELIDRPSASQLELGELAANALAPDVAGVYGVKATNGAERPWAFKVVAFPAEARTWRAIVNPREPRTGGGRTPDVLPRNETRVRQILWQLAGCMLASNGNAVALFEALTPATPVPNNFEGYCDAQ